MRASFMMIIETCVLTQTAGPRPGALLCSSQHTRPTVGTSHPLTSCGPHRGPAGQQRLVSPKGRPPASCPTPETRPACGQNEHGCETMPFVPPNMPEHAQNRGEGKQGPQAPWVFGGWAGILTQASAPRLALRPLHSVGFQQRSDIPWLLEPNARKADVTPDSWDQL